MILDKLIRHKTKEAQVIWGVRVPEKVKMRWLMLAAIMRVPTNRLILYVLNDWVQQNRETLVDDSARHQLADRITELYLKGNLN